MASGPDPKPGTTTGGYKERFWIPRIWEGINVSAWVRVLVLNRFQINPWRIGMALILTFAAGVNSCFGAVQALLLGRKIRRTEIEEHPIFIIGHWRSGTTLLHELLIRDPRHTYPDTYACFAPNHFLVSRGIFPPLLSVLMPPCRPQDNMALGWDRPQEDEFALCNMGVPSPYLGWMFPNRPPIDQAYLDLEAVPSEALRRWKRGFLRFLKCLTLRTPKRIVLKSPPHTCRVKVLLELFPRARFVHIYRDPYVVFPSTINLWRRLSRDQGLQHPRYDGLEEQVFENFTHMYDVFERDRGLIAPGRFSEVSYEDLVADPIGQLRRIYDELDLGDFERVQPRVEAFLASQADYQRNRYEISPQTRAEITRRWGAFIRKYGYATTPAEV